MNGEEFSQNQIDKINKLKSILYDSLSEEITKVIIMDKETYPIDLQVNAVGLALCSVISRCLLSFFYSDNKELTKKSRDIFLSQIFNAATSITDKLDGELGDLDKAIEDLIRLNKECKNESKL